MKKLFLLLLTVFALNSCEQDPEIIGLDAEKKRPKVNVCHYDAVTNTWKTITISENALKAHLKHGDFEGSCESGTIIGPEGGDVYSDDGKIMVLIPPNSLSEYQLIKIVQSDENSPLSELDIVPLTNTYNLQPEGLKFNEHITIKILESLDENNYKNILGIHWWESDQMEILNVEFKDGMYSFQINHFSNVLVASFSDELYNEYNPNAQTFLEKYDQTTWITTTDNGEKLYKFYSDTNNPFDIWFQEEIGSSCHVYNNTKKAWGENFEITKNSDNELIIQSSSGNYTDILEFTMEGETLNLIYRLIESGEEEIIWNYNLEKTSRNVDEINVCVF